MNGGGQQSGTALYTHTYSINIQTEAQEGYKELSVERERKTQQRRDEEWRGEEANGEFNRWG